MQPLLELRKVSRTYEVGNQALTVLTDLTLDVMRGEFVAIVGPSGSGKSTLLNIIGLLDGHTNGTYSFNGADVGSMTARQRDELRKRQIGFVFQDAHMVGQESAAVNADLPLRIRGLGLGDRRRRVLESLEQFGIAGRANTPASALSGGERQRVALARATVTRPTLILADEPTGALDSVNSARVVDFLRTLSESGTTVVVITHDEQIAKFAHRIIRLVDGAVDASSSALAHHEDPVLERPILAPLEDGRPLLRVGGEIGDALSALTRSVVRTAVLLTAFVLGVGGLVASTGISESAAAQVTARLTQASLNEVVVRASDPAAYSYGYYDAAGALDSIRAIPHVTAAGLFAPLIPAATRLRVLPEHESDSRFDGVIAIGDSGYLKAQGAVTSPVTAAALLETDWNARVAVLGQEAASSLGVPGGGSGVKIWVGSISVDVVGVIDNVGSDESLANTVLLSRPAAAGITPEDPRILVRTELGYPAAVAMAIPAAVAPGDPSSVQVETVADLRNLQVGVASDLSALIAVVSATLLGLACLTSAVAMFLTVQARSAEVALRRAVGASRFAIWRLFTFEGLLIGAAGGLIGASVGLCFTVVACALNQWTPVLDPLLVAAGLGVGSITGVIASAYPATVAARADPAQVIRR